MTVAKEDRAQCPGERYLSREFLCLGNGQYRSGAGEQATLDRQGRWSVKSSPQTHPMQTTYLESPSKKISGRAQIYRQGIQVGPHEMVIDLRIR